VAIGECGLDYHYDFSPRPAQREAFAAQVGLAKEHGLALVVHTREAWEDTFAILASQGMPERTVFHCFTGGRPEASRALEMGAWLSFSGIITFKNATDIRAAAALCPLERILVETDSPYLAPVPHRGKPNSPALVLWSVRRWRRSRASTWRPWRRRPGPGRRRCSTCRDTVPAEVQRLLEDNHISPSRALGQNFVADANTVRRIARLSGVGPGDRWWRSGPALAR